MLAALNQAGPVLGSPHTTHPHLRRRIVRPLREGASGPQAVALSFWMDGKPFGLEQCRLHAALGQRKPPYFRFIALGGVLKAIGHPDLYNRRRAKRLSARGLALGRDAAPEKVDVRLRRSAIADDVFARRRPFKRPPFDNVATLALAARTLAAAGSICPSFPRVRAALLRRGRSNQPALARTPPSVRQSALPWRRRGAFFC